ncbi:MAG: ABC transporter substrate-binding protein [Microvirga sp.]|jgi:peptide/nickel transport system substrate-binding protein|nr:ABC transporter substrate-binding protein [Beijerinckiaceae bacterium]
MIGKTIRHLAVGAASLLAGTGAALAGKANDTFVWTTSTEIGPPDLYYGNQREVLIIAYAQCDSLLHRDPVSNDYKPLLAETWTWLDPTTLELTLRKGVKFHDGRDFGAQDVADTLNHVARPDSGMQIRVIIDWIKNVEVVAPDKVRIHAKAPTPAALEFLSGTTPIYPRGHYESAPTVPAPDGKTRRDWGAVKPICTGPYILKDHKPGQSVTLTKNPNYFAGSPKGKPQIGTIVYRTIKDAETQVAELLTGGVDWIWGVPPENAKQLGAMPNVVVKSAATMRMSFLSLDAAGRTGDTPLKDVRVRRAIFHAIDREAIAKNLVGEGAAVQKSLCVPVQFGCTTEVPDYPYDPAKAKALLAEAGHPNLSIPFYAYRDRPYSEAVLNYLRQAGIKPELKFLQWQALRPLIIEGKTEVAHLTFGSNGILDASASTSYYFRHSVDDYARDPEVRDWLAEADTSTDPENRKALYAKALKKINDQAYAVPLFIYGRTYAYSQDFEFPLTQDEMAHFYMARWK